MGQAVVLRLIQAGLALGPVAFGAGAAWAETVAVNLQLTSSAAVNAGVVPGRAYRFVYSGAVTGSLTGEFSHALNIEPEAVWWPAAAVPWDTLLVTTPRGSFTASLAAARLTRTQASDAAPGPEPGPGSSPAGPASSPAPPAAAPSPSPRSRTPAERPTR